MKIHLWEAYDPKRISVNIKKEMKDRLKKSFSKRVYLISKKLKIHPARIYDYFIYQNSPIPLNVLIDISKILRISLLEIEKNISLYKQMFVPNKNSVKNPRLPLKITPYFTSIIANLFFDGSVPKDGKGTYYHQKNKEIMNDFINKVKNVFGNAQYSINLDHRGVLKCRLPRIIGEICKHVYGIENFGTFDSKIPSKIFNLKIDHKIAFILTGIIDEGSISYDGSVIFSVSNKKMIKDFNNLCGEVGLKTGGIKQKRRSNSYYIYIKNIKKIIDLLEKSKKGYPLIDLNYKEERLRKSLEIKNKKYSYSKEFAENREKLILYELKKSGKTINYFSAKFLIPPRTLRRYMYKLMKKGKIKREKIRNEYVYSLG